LGKVGFKRSKVLGSNAAFLYGWFGDSCVVSKGSGGIWFALLAAFWGYLCYA
jgi:hypothetical protein